MTSTNTFNLQGRVALVTGASHGIGRSIAILLAQHGAHVIVSSRKANACEDTVATIKNAGGSAEARAMHVGSPEQIEAMFQHIDRTHGFIDVLVNNAAANPYFGPAVEITPAAFDKTFEVNVRGSFFATVQALRRMQARATGTVVNVSSISAVVPGPSQGVYSITKAALVSMTRMFAAECGSQGVRVNAILPGITRTRFAAALVEDEGMRSSYLERVPLGRVGEPDEIATAALYFASDASSYTTGSCLAVDGGYLSR